MYLMSQIWMENGWMLRTKNCTRYNRRVGDKWAALLENALTLKRYIHPKDWKPAHLLACQLLHLMLCTRLTQNQNQKTWRIKATSPMVLTPPQGNTTKLSLPMKLVIGTKISTSKAAKICQKLSEEGVNIATLSQPAVYKALFRRATQVSSIQIWDLFLFTVLHRGLDSGVHIVQAWLSIVFCSELRATTF